MNEKKTTKDKKVILSYFNMELLEKNLDETQVKEFIDYYVKLNAELDKRQADLDEEKIKYKKEIDKQIIALDKKKAELKNNYTKMKNELISYENYLDKYKKNLSDAQSKFYNYQKSELAKILKIKDELFKESKKKITDEKNFNKNCSVLQNLISQFEKEVKKIDK